MDHDNNEQVKVNVLDLQRSSDMQRSDFPRQWSSSESESSSLSSSNGLRLLPGENNPHHSASMALVSAASRNLNSIGNGNFNFNFNSNGNFNDNVAGGTEGRARRRGPSPIHGGGVAGRSLDDDTEMVEGIVRCCT